MRKARPRQQAILALGIVLLLVLTRGQAFALDPSLDVSQYAHTAWRIREGFAKGSINSIAQTPDGYLWLATEFGLFRFDGVRNVPFQPPSGQSLPSNWITSLLAAHDGTLWIGTKEGLSSWKGGKLTQYPELYGQGIGSLLQDRDGTLWVGAWGLPTGRLCAIQNNGVRCDGKDGILEHGVFGLYEDSKGNLWAGVSNGLWRWKPGPSKFYSIPDSSDSIRAFAEDDDGTLLIGTRTGVRRFVEGKIEAYPITGAVQQFQPIRLLRDREGGLWIASLGQGLVHVHQGKTDVFTESDGLSANYLTTLVEDREGNIWIASGGGLDRFREFAVPTASVAQGLSNSGVNSVLAAKDGSVWLGTQGGLYRWKDGRITAFGTRTGQSQLSGVEETGGDLHGKLNGQNPHCLFQDDRGRIWVSTLNGIGSLQNNRFNAITSVPGGIVHGIAEDNSGNLWIANQTVGLIRLSPRNDVQQIPWAGLGRTDHASALIADPLRGGLWIGFFHGDIIYFSAGGARERYSADDGLGQGSINSFQLDPGGALWAATEGGLSRLKDGRIATLTSKNGLPCDAVHWMIEDDAHSFWLYMACGLVRIARSELDAWAGAVDKNDSTKQTIHATVFDTSDGVRSTAAAGGYKPQVAKSSDGRFWFATLDGVSIIDPQHLHLNKLPPPVHIEQIIADHKAYDTTADSSGRVRLPAHLRDLQIDYTALSLVAREKVLFRYKLEGWDRDWQDAGTRRQAFYSNLPPRNYTFRVMACNNSGVWNEAGTSLNFFVAPAYYQTWWFRSACVLAFLGLLVLLYQMRLRRLSQQFNMRLEARVQERTRIARELHDTLLQSFQGVLLKFHAVTYTVVDRPVDAQNTLKSVIEQARQAITEGRDAVQGLRAPGLAGNDIAQALSVLGKDLGNYQNGAPCPDFKVQVEGTPRDLSPLLRDDIYRIGCEALRNAFQHAHARRIELELRYDQRQLRLRIRDDGKGIDPKVLAAGGKIGHYGLPGMHERAKLVGGKLAVWSEINSGTETELIIPASVVYEKSNAARRPSFWPKGA